MARDAFIPVYVDPLSCFFADQRLSDLRPQTPTLENLLEYLCVPGIDRTIESLISRYQEIMDERQELIAAPSEMQILEKLFWPLRNAIASYMLGNYLGTVSLCGAVAEMIAILLFDISKIEFQGSPMTVETQKTLFGSTFEELGQDRRVKLLAGLRIIDATLRTRFDEIRNIRKKYLHCLSRDHSSLAADAVACFQAILGIVITVLGQEVHDGKLTLNAKLMAHLHEKGLVDTSAGA